MSLIAHDLHSKSRSQDVLLEDGNVSFASFYLAKPILLGLNSCGFRRPSPIQVKAIPIGRCGLDIIVKSKSGTGKTLVFGIVALEVLNLINKEPQVLILTPTREIAIQIAGVLKDIGQFYNDLYVETFIGGLPVEDDILKCRKCQIAIGTPGRVKQMISMGHLTTKQVRLFVLDEADKLVEDSFQNDINVIYNALPEKKQVIMCSATYPNEMQNFLGEYMLSPSFISAEVNTPLLLGLKQFVRIIKSSPNVVQQTKVKNEELLKLLSSISFTQCLVFSNFQTRAESISNFLNRNNFQSTFISAAQKQLDRLKAINDLKEFKCKILLSTDLTARGIDAANVDLVVNYDIPTDAMTYLHRMGRAGRYGSTGICVNLAAQGQEVGLLQNILGSIGGVSLSIPKLDGSYSVEKVNMSDENLVFGVTIEESSTELRANVINDIKLQSRNSEQKSAENKIEDTNPFVILSEPAQGNIEYVQNNIEKSNNSEISTAELFAQLGSSDKNVEKPSENCNADDDDSDDLNSILQQLAAEGSISSSRICEEHQSEMKGNELLIKNKALFSIAKGLSNCATSKDDSEYLTQYLNDIKKKDDAVIFGESKEMVYEPVTNHNIAENIFSVAYNCAIIEGEVSWKEMIFSKNELKKLRENEEQGESSNFEDLQEEDAFHGSEQDNSEDFYDPDYDFEIEKDIKINFAKNRTRNTGDHQSLMKWIPVVSSSKKSPKKGARQSRRMFEDNVLQLPTTSSAQVMESYCEQYQKYFEPCSEALWQNGLSFESVDQFDQWFWYDWQSQVGAVRNFIRQKIYVEEMNRYDQNNCHKS